jgi:uncharacterized membrane protein YsdA (DUF1294 family)
LIETALLLLLALNLVTFLLFGWDKRRARRQGWRTPESTLLGFSWLGGFLGGWWGMRVFRHKTRKMSFRVKMVLATLLSPLWLAVWFYLEKR